MLVWIIVVAFIGLILLIKSSVTVVRDHETAYVKRFGQHSGKTESGLVVTLPLLSKVHKVDKSDKKALLQDIEMVTNDGGRVSVDCYCTFNVQEPYKVDDRTNVTERKVKKVLEGILRDSVASRDTDRIVQNKTHLSRITKAGLQSQMEQFGVGIREMKIQNIDVLEEPDGNELSTRGMNLSQNEVDW